MGVPLDVAILVVPGYGELGDEVRVGEIVRESHDGGSAMGASAARMQGDSPFVFSDMGGWDNPRELREARSPLDFTLTIDKFTSMHKCSTQPFQLSILGFEQLLPCHRI